MLNAALSPYFFLKTKFLLNIIYCMLLLGNITRKHSIHFNFYTQFYLFIKPDDINRLVKVQACLKDLHNL